MFGKTAVFVDRWQSGKSGGDRWLAQKHDWRDVAIGHSSEFLVPRTCRADLPCRTVVSFEADALRRLSIGWLRPVSRRKDGEGKTLRRVDAGQPDDQWHG